MKTLDPDSPAFPVPGEPPSFTGDPRDGAGVGREPVAGLTVRQHFAGLAMHGILATVDRDDTAAEVARLAVECADALISELNKP